MAPGAPDKDLQGVGDGGTASQQLGVCYAADHSSNTLMAAAAVTRLADSHVADTKFFVPWRTLVHAGPVEWPPVNAEELGVLMFFCRVRCLNAEALGTGQAASSKIGESETRTQQVSQYVGQNTFKIREYKKKDST